MKRTIRRKQGELMSPRRKRSFKDAPADLRCQWDITLRDRSKAQCGRARKPGRQLCAQHQKIYDAMGCEYCGLNDELPPDHCTDCTRPTEVSSWGLGMNTRTSHATYLGKPCEGNLAPGMTALIRTSSSPEWVFAQFDSIHAARGGEDLAFGWHLFDAADFEVTEGAGGTDEP